jgi:hypothetical protein
MGMPFNSSSYTACIKTVAAARCLAKRRLTADHSGFQASCHSILDHGSASKDVMAKFSGSFT